MVEGIGMIKRVEGLRAFQSCNKKDSWMAKRERSVKVLPSIGGLVESCALEKGWLTRRLDQGSRKRVAKAFGIEEESK